MGSKEAHKTSSAQCHCNRFPPCAATIEHHFYFLVLSNYPHVHLCLNGVIIIVTALFCNIYMKKKIPIAGKHGLDSCPRLSGLPYYNSRFLVQGCGSFGSRRSDETVNFNGLLAMDTSSARFQIKFFVHWYECPGADPT